MIPNRESLLPISTRAVGQLTDDVEGLAHKFDTLKISVLSGLLSGLPIGGVALYSAVGIAAFVPTAVVLGIVIFRFIVPWARRRVAERNFESRSRNLLRLLKVLEATQQLQSPEKERVLDLAFKNFSRYLFEAKLTESDAQRLLQINTVRRSSLETVGR